MIPEVPSFEQIFEPQDDRICTGTGWRGTYGFETCKIHDEGVLEGVGPGNIDFFGP
jgi:hypothetical protein